ncbi:reverse transcriptase domain, reverse transcriptase zinc-binding domain protein [Tanacetum coccineum]
MEVLTLMLQRRVQASDCFTYHRYCSKLDLINLCFADDLFLFAYGDVNSASIIKDTLDEFKNVSGLVPSIPKSTAYFCNVLNHVKLAILHVLPFEEGRLPVKYLGVPLVSSRLMVRDCNELVDKVQLCVQDWKNKALSIAGRLQLIQSVLGSKHIYWASVFTLPTSVLLNIEQILRHFLWCHGSSGKGKSKVAWEIVCLPKEEGGLGIRRLECFNLALMATHVWKLLILKESLWGWINILSLRPIIRRFIWSKVGNGNTTSIWYDQWSTLEPLAHRVSSRDIVRSGLTLQSKVSDIVVNGSWSWPVDLLSKYPFLSNYNTPINDNVDRLVWSDSHGNIKKFSVAQVWSDIRSRDTKVNWYSMVWFPSCIPRHAINLWLIIRRKLKTQDLIPSWDVSNNLGSVCSLCESIPDSHDHIFFECIFARSVWNRLKGLAGLDSSNCNIYDLRPGLLCSLLSQGCITVVKFCVYEVAQRVYFSFTSASKGLKVVNHSNVGYQKRFQSIKFGKLCQSPNGGVFYIPILSRLKKSVGGPMRFCARVGMADSNTVMSSDSASSEESDSPEAAPASSDYVPGPEEPKQAPLSPDYVPGPKYPGYLAPSDEEVPMEDQPYVVADSPIALSPGYVADSDPEEDPEEDSEEGPVDYPADGGDDDDDDSSDDDEEEEASMEEEAEEEYLALSDSVVAPVVDNVPSSEETEPFETDESAPTPRSPQTIVPFSQICLRMARKTVKLEPPMSPSMEARIAEYVIAPTPPSPPPSPLSPWSSPLPQIPSPPLPLSSLHLPPPIPTSLPLPSSPLPPLPASLFIPPPVDRREDTPEAELPPRKRLCLTALISRYEVEESSTASPRPAGGHGIDYGFIGTLDAETKRQRAEEVGYGIRDT